MIKNYLKVALRNLMKNRIFSFINIFGLATGMACSLLIFLFIRDELSYDRFHKDSDDIYRVVQDHVNEDGTQIPDAKTAPALATAIQREIPEASDVTRAFANPDWGANFLIKYRDKKFNEGKIFWVDSTFFDVFTFPFVKGNAKSALNQINSIVITESTAKKYFGSENPMGKTLQVDQFLGALIVTGVLKDLPSNSHFHFDFAVSIKKLGGEDPNNDWGWDDFYTYAKLKPYTKIVNFIKKIQDIYKQSNPAGKNIFYTQPLTGIHLTSNLKSELEPNSDKLYIYVFTIIGIFIILIAGINYVNLATAKASIRAKEVGIRKVAGASRKSLINQFLLESVITCLIASVLAVVSAQLLLPVVNTITQKQLTVIGNPAVFGYIIMAALFLGIVAGLFPAIYLSSFKLVTVLKGMWVSDKGTLSLRKAMVVIQFTISITLIIGALVIAEQMHFIQSSKLGLNKDQVVIVKNAWSLSDAEKDAFQNSVLQIPGVKKIAMSDGVIGGQNWTREMHLEGSHNSQPVNFLSVGNDFLDVLGMELKEGRSFSAKFPSDAMKNVPNDHLKEIIGSVVLNETSVKYLGVPEPAVGKNIFWGGNYLKVIGVVKDFHFTSFRTQIKPFAFVNIPSRMGNFTIKLSTDNIKGALAQLENTWKKFSPQRPFEYIFLDETYAKLYQSETRFQKVFISLVILGIIISCLGLLGLTIFAAQQRIKEIGIRKVLGASVSEIVRLLSKDFLKLVLISLLLSIPIAWFFMNKWLQDFAYRINIQWWIFLVAGMIALFIAFATICSQAIKAAMANPIKNLRTE
jgi:putative ABC transport system permease protein